MSAEVRVLRTGQDRCRQSVLETLLEVDDAAAKGEVVGVGIAIVRPDGSINSCFSDCDNIGTLIGATELLKQRLLKAIDE